MLSRLREIVNVLFLAWDLAPFVREWFGLLVFSDCSLELSAAPLKPHSPIFISVRDGR